jgi:hypothetical protein
MPDDFHLPRTALDVLDYEIASERVALAMDGAKVCPKPVRPASPLAK